MDPNSEALSMNQAAAPSRWARWDGWLEAISERLNPILVKEARQAMKSRQFGITFLIVLIAVWFWTMLAVINRGPDLQYRAFGGELFQGYFFILSFPLAIIVPYGAFRSLAQECEDRTYELLSITTLHPRQIILGKLASAMVQMLVYFSAVAPCLAFTYLLRGIDIILILYLLGLAGLGSLGLSLIGLFLATISAERHWQIVLSVLLIVGLVLSFVGGNILCEEFIRREYRALQQGEFWVAMAGLFTLYASSFALILCAATAQLTFPTSNRSTPLRIAMFVQGLLYVGWIGAILNVERRYLVEPLLILLCFAAGYWFIMGSFMVAESAELSLRVRRTLPGSASIAALTSWFYPGPGRGLLFAITNFAGYCSLALLALLIFKDSTTQPWRMLGADFLLLASAMLLAYLVIFLGLTQMIVRGLRGRGWGIGVAAGPLVAVILVILGVLVPLIIDTVILQRYRESYSLLHLSNPFWTLEQMTISRITSTGETIGAVLLGLTAIGVFLANLRAVFQDLNFVRVAQPVRVVEDEAALHPPPPKRPTNPWDAEPDEPAPPRA